MNIFKVSKLQKNIRIQIHNMLVLTADLYDEVIWTIKSKDKSRIIAAA
jgi:hypothetical protein